MKKYRFIDNLTNTKDYSLTTGTYALFISAAIVSGYFIMCFLGQILDNNVLVLLISVSPTILAITLTLGRKKVR